MGRTLSKDTEKKSNKRSVGIFLSLLQNTKILISPPKTAPTKESPGKYGNKKKTKELKKLELGLDTTKKSRDPRRENIAVINAMLKIFSIETSRLRNTKSSLLKRYKLNKKMTKQSIKTIMKNCIFSTQFKIRAVDLTFEI